jgi:hypothetical protein
MSSVVRPWPAGNCVSTEAEECPLHNSDKDIDVESQGSDKFHCTSATTDTKKVRFYNESYLSTALHGLVIQVVLFRCVSSVTNNLQMQQWLQQN